MPGCPNGAGLMQGMSPSPALLWRMEGKEDKPLSDLRDLHISCSGDAPHPGPEGVAL